MKKIIGIVSISFFLFTNLILADDFISITDPIASSYGTVSGNPLVISGTSSLANTTVRLFINTTEQTTITTDAYGNWNTTSSDLANGTYMLTALLVVSSSPPIITTQSFTVYNGETINISSPTQASAIVLNPVTLSGTASLSNATINIYLDGTLVATTTTDAQGNWQYSYTLTTTNGSHTFLVDLLEYGYEYPVASASVDIVNSIPFVFPSGTSQARFVNGDVPTSGSGSGPGYTYSVSGSTITINFVPAFSTTPSMTTTGLRSAGSSTVSLTAVSATAATIGFSSGTQVVHFSAATLQ